MSQPPRLNYVPMLTLNIERNDGSEQPTHPQRPSLCGMPLKYISLVTLAFQNSLLTIVMHYSRISTPPSQRYSAATAVLLVELLKGSISFFIAFSRVDISSSSSPQVNESQSSYFVRPRAMFWRFRKLGKEILSSDCWKLSIPAMLYVIQNNLQFVAVSNLDAATFQVSYQMKILTTAAFSVLLLKRRLASFQWVSLLFLAVGVGLVQIQANTAPKTPPGQSLTAHTLNPVQGFMAVAAACFTSGLAGVYFEMILKNTQADLWVRNVQLSLFSLLPALVPVIFSHATDITSHGASLHSLFHDFGISAWATVAIQVLGGLVTAVVIKYSDNILKGFATSLSITLSFLASVALFEYQITFTFILGSTTVLIATLLYNQPQKSVDTCTEKDSRQWVIMDAEDNRGFYTPVNNDTFSPANHTQDCDFNTDVTKDSKDVFLSSVSFGSRHIPSGPVLSR